MNQMSRTIKALSTLDIYKSSKLESLSKFQNLWSRYLEAVCTCDPLPRLQWGMRRGAGACVWGCGGGGGAAPPPGSSPWQRPRTATSSASSSRGAASSARQPWSGQLYSYSYIWVTFWLRFLSPELNIPWLFVRRPPAPRSADSSTPRPAARW